MADREKVIEGLEWIISLFSNYERHAIDDEEMQSLTDAIVLLKAQEPKPVKITKNFSNYKFYNCPNCGRDFELTYYKRPAYCDKCGQAVKWDEVD